MRLEPLPEYDQSKSTMTTIGATTKIRPIIIITFGTTNVVLHNGITFGADIDVGTGIGALKIW